MRKITGLIMILFASLMAGAGGLMAADGDWTVKSDVQGSYAGYSSSTLRNSFTSGGVLISADYLDRGGITLGGNLSSVNFKVGNDINQQSAFVSLWHNIFADVLPGVLTLRLDGHFINNDDATGDTDGVKVFAPRISFLNFDKTFYLDMGYAHSTYRNNLTVNQYSPTIGFGFNAGADWLQLRVWLIDPSNSLRAQNINSTTALEIKLTHWLAPDAWLGVDNIRTNILLGKRIYAVDGDAAAVYNLADIQRDSISFGAQWRLTESVGLLLFAGHERYLNNTISDAYASNYVYANLSAEW
jgi:hypothetical protein